ncbi:hypothetical protein [Nonomuraea lactucae]|uniref:hypothetical protein n=1 Tax=Nonomuraea lactucae TaxID=2249762 RepID=UPI000DE43AFA|nr:hypothetical protein [Nonomuraea lactucae]
MRPIPFDLHVTVTGNSPHEIEQAAYPVAESFYGTKAEIDVLSAKAEPDPDTPGAFRATIVFRRIATGGETC